MRVRWSREASDDIGRLHAFLLPSDPHAAARVAQMLIDAPDKLLDHPRLGERLDRYGGREIRHLHVGDYDMRYAFDGEVISIIRIWHDREDR